MQFSVIDVRHWHACEQEEGCRADLKVNVYGVSTNKDTGHVFVCLDEPMDSLQKMVEPSVQLLLIALFLTSYSSQRIFCHSNDVADKFFLSLP